MADNKLTVFSARALAQIRAVVRETMNERQNPSNRPVESVDIPPAPEVYVAYTSAGIPQMVEPDGFGSDQSDSDKPASDLCPIFRLVDERSGGKGLQKVDGLYRLVYNLSATAGIPRETFFKVDRDKFGVWWAQSGQSSGVASFGKRYRPVCVKGLLEGFVSVDGGYAWVYDADYTHLLGCVKCTCTGTGTGTPIDCTCGYCTDGTFQHYWCVHMQGASVPLGCDYLFACVWGSGLIDLCHYIIPNNIQVVMTLTQGEGGIGYRWELSIIYGSDCLIALYYSNNFTPPYPCDTPITFYFSQLGGCGSYCSQWPSTLVANPSGNSPSSCSGGNTGTGTGGGGYCCFGACDPFGGQNSPVVTITITNKVGCYTALPDTINLPCNTSPDLTSHGWLSTITYTYCDGTNTDFVQIGCFGSSISPDRPFIALNKSPSNNIIVKAEAGYQCFPFMATFLVDDGAGNSCTITAVG